MSYGALQSFVNTSVSIRNISATRSNRDWIIQSIFCPVLGRATCRNNFISVCLSWHLCVCLVVILFGSPAFMVLLVILYHQNYCSRRQATCSLNTLTLLVWKQLTDRNLLFLTIKTSDWLTVLTLTTDDTQISLIRNFSTGRVVHITVFWISLCTSVYHQKKRYAVDRMRKTRSKN